MFNTVLCIIEGPDIFIEKYKIDPDSEGSEVYQHSVCVHINIQYVFTFLSDFFNLIWGKLS